METCKSQSEHTCVELCEEDHKILQHLKAYFGLHGHDLLHMILSEFDSKMDLRDIGGKARTAPVTYHSRRIRRAYLEMAPTKSGHADQVTHFVSQYDYTYYPHM